jgi:hypothetical protein
VRALASLALTTFFNPTMNREALLNELKRLKLYGYFVPAESIQLANEIDLESVQEMHITAAAMLVVQLASKSSAAKHSLRES